jgi:hypothetical protein
MEKGTGPIGWDEPVAGSGDIRPIHYIGNKSRYLDAIEQVVEGVAEPGSAACDLFAGTSVVTRRLAQRRPVVSADIQAYSQVLARALTQPASFSCVEVDALLDAAREWLRTVRSQTAELLSFESSAQAHAADDPAPLAALVEHGSFATHDDGPPEFVVAKQRARHGLKPDTATLTWYYGGVYFSYAQALELDALRHAIRDVAGRSDTLVAAVMGAASDTVSTVGNHFAQPVQPRHRDGSLKRSWVVSVARRRRYPVLEGFARWLARYGEMRPTMHCCTAIQSDFQQTLSGLGPEVGVIYADPPYTRDHYSRFYHVLETIALDDDPGVSPGQDSMSPSRGLYRVDRHQSPFSIRSQVRPAFQELFASAKRLDVPMVLSYSPMSEGTKARPETRLMSIQELVDMAAGYFAEVRLFDVAASSHSRFNRVEVNAAIDGAAEVLIVARN